MISVHSAAMRAFILAGSLLSAAAHADTPPAQVDANWATAPAPAAEPRWQDSLPPAPPVEPREEKILPKSEWLTVEPMKAPDHRCDPGLDALFLPKECGKEPSWLGSRKK
ncbi:hypothetical protein ACWYXK_15765 [Janthinobacterium lividum]|jgi:hypothetical protein|uniref:hypothetical protein n=1 Tax=Janthinobacterium TaxID=29580 RepID=UPI0008746AC2|nr:MULTISPECIES: hypothetical protein [Janthinobacterium]MCC7698216.1 hypothetical protein [Janthinobacterium sp. EB271-G4-7A]OEZ50004.1 hypothetical protein JAB1_11170 [Janthinobacterium sp. MP5059B]PHV50192.1 hypothetical protein CSQ91_03095 [Janthinobacterium sp. BJB301]PIF08612.1 hypothetical protein CLU94_0573 [Janthinobacterium sp. 13]QKY02969.1 hypothetical protein G3257_12390 [Janthinobacterium lividum]